MQQYPLNSEESLIGVDRESDSVYSLRELIQRRLGLSLSDQYGIELIVNKFTGRMKLNHCKSFLEYYRLLSSRGAAAEEEWRQVMALLAKSKSGFYRQISAVRALVDVALPHLLSRSRTDPASRSEPLRIWSTSCATGEEPLSIAMALTEAGWFERVPIEIHASDASYVVLESAMQGVYCEQRVSALDPLLRDKYFTREEHGWRAVPELERLIRWRIANLMDQNEVADLAQSHVIFCRNVFIYFTEAAICETLRFFARLMPAGGFLFSDSGDYFTSLVASIGFFEPFPSGGSGIWARRNE